MIRVEQETETGIEIYLRKLIKWYLNWFINRNYRQTIVTEISKVDTSDFEESYWISWIYP